MASKIKVDTIENVAGSGNVSLGSGHNLVVPGTLAITGASTLTGNVGIGNARTDGTLHVHSGSAGTVSASTQADDLVVENSAEGGITIITPDNESARIRFTSPSTNTDVGGATIFYRQNINKMNVGTAVAGGILDLLSGAGVSAIKADANGRVTIPNQPSFFAGMSSQVSATNEITFSSGNVKHNIGSHFAHGTGRFTAPVAGRYFFSFNSLQNGAGAQMTAVLKINGGALGLYMRTDGDSSEHHHTSASGIFNLAASDYVSVFVTGGVAYGDTSTYWSSFHGHLLG